MEQQGGWTHLSRVRLVSQLSHDIGASESGRILCKDSQRSTVCHSVLLNLWNENIKNCRRILIALFKSHMSCRAILLQLIFILMRYICGLCSAAPKSLFNSRCNSVPTSVAPSLINLGGMLHSIDFSLSFPNGAYYEDLTSLFRNQSASTV